MLMQVLGFSLATKQSSMTAAALAGSIKSSGDASELVAMIARVTRSQLAAALGNVAIVIPSALAGDLLWQHYYNTHYFTTEYAHHFIESIQANDPALAAYAGITGVLLWASSLAAGWLENWAVYRRLPEAIAQHRIKRIVGERVTKWASRVFAHNIAGVGGNIAIGLLLGLTPILAKFAGLPIDIRHITLSTGSLTLSIVSLGSGSLGEPEIQRAALGILVIGAMNFGVSFVLALTIAMRAREVTWIQALRMLFALAVGFLKSPVRFFLPVERAPEGAQKKAH
jgi:site-specific recombinase